MSPQARWKSSDRGSAEFSRCRNCQRENQNVLCEAFLVIGVAVVAITTAPTALAGPSEQACTDIGGSTQCQRMGNVQIYTAPKDLPATPKST